MKQPEYLFSDAYDGLDTAHFAGRVDERTMFASFVNGREPNVTHRVWIISGVRAIGKTSFCEWCFANATGPGAKGRMVGVRIDHLRDNMPRRALRRTVASRMLSHSPWRLLSRVTNALRACYENVSDIPYIGGGLRIQDLKDGEFVRWLLKSCQKEAKTCDCLIIVCDGLSEGGDGAAITLFCNLARELNAQHQRSALSGEASRVALIGSMLPGWQSQAHLGTPPRGATHIVLEPLRMGDVRELVEIELRLCSAQWEVAEGVAEELYTLTGGFPQLVQKLGRTACRIAWERRRHTKLEVQDLVDAWSDSEFTPLARKVVSDCGYAFPRTPSTAATLSVLSRFGVEDALSDREAARGVLKSEWKKVARQSNMVKQEYDAAFEEVFSHLTRAHVLRRVLAEQEVYQFCPVRLRPLLAEIVSEIDRS